MEINDLREDFINPIMTKAISSEGFIFEIGDEVYHEGSDEENGFGVIESFKINQETNDVIASTTKGYGKISFMYKKI